jgi:hypothetical protein
VCDLHWDSTKQASRQTAPQLQRSKEGRRSKFANPDIELTERCREFVSKEAMLSIGLHENDAIPLRLNRSESHNSQVEAGGPSLIGNQVSEFRPF